LPTSNPNELERETAVSLRLYVVCALSITTSAVAGLLFGGFMATSHRDEEAVSVRTVPVTVPVAESTALP